MAEALVETTSDLGNMVKGSPSQYVKVTRLGQASITLVSSLTWVAACTTPPSAP